MISPTIVLKAILPSIFLGLLVRHLLFPSTLQCNSQLTFEDVNADQGTFQITYFPHDGIQQCLSAQEPQQTVLFQPCIKDNPDQVWKSYHHRIILAHTEQTSKPTCLEYTHTSSYPRCLTYQSSEVNLRPCRHHLQT
jgi:hypothetical protein